MDECSYVYKYLCLYCVSQKKTSKNHCYCTFLIIADLVPNFIKIRVDAEKLYLSIHKLQTLLLAKCVRNKIRFFSREYFASYMQHTI
jgi:hypothetical protein